MVSQHLSATLADNSDHGHYGMGDGFDVRLCAHPA